MQWFEFSLKVKVMGFNPGYLLKSFLPFCTYSSTRQYWILDFFSDLLSSVLSPDEATVGFEAAACVDLSALDGLNLDFPPLNSNNSNNYRLIFMRVIKKIYLSFILFPVFGLFSLISEVIKLLYYLILTYRWFLEQFFVRFSDTLDTAFIQRAL